MMYTRQKQQPKPYWHIRLKSNECKFWNDLTCECEHPKKSPNFGDFKCMKSVCPISVVGRLNNGYKKLWKR